MMRGIPQQPLSAGGHPRWWQRAGLLLIGAALLWASWMTQEPDGYPHLIVYLIFPVILYLGLLAPFNRYGAAAVTAALIYCLHVVNQKKILATSEPLLAIDLVQFGQAAALTSYVDTHAIVAAAVLALALCWALIFQRSRARWWLRAVFVAPLAFVLLVQSGAVPGVSAPVRDVLRESRLLNYIGWDMQKNLRRNGLLAHLWLTSEVSMVPRRAEGEIPFYRLGRAGTQVAPALTRPLDVYLVLCEACWGDEGKLAATPLNRLLQKGLHPATVYSPQFGGVTANAELEMLTGLPAGGLRGVVYLHYGDAMRPRAASLPSELRAEGFKTHAVHNFTRTFWKRNAIYPKLGFDRLTFIEDMPWRGKGWPDDQLLFDAALQQVREKTPDNRFFFLITVYTHGNYLEDEDRGYGDYQRRLGRSMGQLADFIDRVYEHNRSAERQALFVVFGDHKPALLKWFYDERVLDGAVFQSVGATNADFRFAKDLAPEQRKALTSVPLLAGSDNPELRAEELAAQLRRKPFYCVPAALAGRLLRKPSDFFRSVRELCDSERLDGMMFTNELFGAQYFAPAVYADRLFQ